jgi:hypothetical protein
VSIKTDGMLMPIKLAFAGYIKTWYNGLYGSTPSINEFIARGAGKSILFAPDRMIDDAEKVLELYRKANISTQGKNSLLPVVLIAMARDWQPVAESFGHQVGDRQMVCLTEDADASIYGYRQAMGEVRTQVAIIASDSPTAKGLAAQLSMYIGAIANRRFYSKVTWGDYTLDMPVMIESPQVNWMDVKTGQENITILAGDIQLNCVFPFLDAPGDGEENDGSSHNPPGYPSLSSWSITSHAVNPNYSLNDGS